MSKANIYVYRISFHELINESIVEGNYVGIENESTEATPVLT